MSELSKIQKLHVIEELTSGGNRQSLSASKVAQSDNSGFDRELDNRSGLELGQLEYCHNAASGVIYIIPKEGASSYSELSGQTHFSDGTILADRTIGHIPDGNTAYWFQGDYIEVSEAKFCQLSDDCNEHFIAYESDGELHMQTDVQDAIIHNTLISVIANNSIENEPVWFADERHGIVMDGQTHLQQHSTQGFKHVSGKVISGLVNNGETFSSISAGTSGDEDIKMIFAEITEAKTLYRDGLNGCWRLTQTATNLLGHFVGGKCVYNRYTIGTDTWDLAEINSDYVIMSFIATNNVFAPISRLVGQTLYANRGTARDHAPAEFVRLKTEGLPSHEYHSLVSIIIHDESDGQIETGADGEIYVDCRYGYPVQMF